MDAAHARILDLASAAFAAEAAIRDEAGLETHGDRCDDLWAELRRQCEGRVAGALPETPEQIEREVAREVRDRLRRALPDLIASALAE
jgi:hypothetical protein